MKLSVLGLLLMVAGAAQAQLYWRADVGYSWAKDAHIKDKNFAQDGFICGDAACNTGGELQDVGQSAVLSAGVGWRFNPNFRSDVTVAYRGGYKLDDKDAFPNSTFKADITSWNAMLNGYYDFTLGWGRPYVGAGLGWASNKVDNVVNTINGVAFTAPGGTKSGVAWSLMAGVGIPLGSAITLDIGYRFIDLGKLETDPGNVTMGGAVVGTYSGATGKLQAHELMIGLRF